MSLHPLASSLAIISSLGNAAFAQDALLFVDQLQVIGELDSQT